MSTSLAEQLKKLKAPQTDILLQHKGRASLLFDAKEADSLDKHAVLDIGQSGLNELIKLYQLFSEFESTLFAQSSLNFERSVKDADVNKKLNAEIRKFLILLSPYFLLNIAHKALEWLIYRFRIHKFNRDQFLLLILPYHETRMFVRALELVDLTEDYNKWGWLKPLQKPGVPLASTVLISRLVTDNWLLKLLSDHVIFATQTYAENSTSLSTLYTFYTTAIIGAIDQLSSVTEVQVNHLLPTLLKGLEYSTPDLIATCYMILAKLMTKVRLNDATIEGLFLTIFKKQLLRQEATILLLYAFGNPFNSIDTVSDRLTICLTELTWFPDFLINAQSSNINIAKFIQPLLKTACTMILSNAKETISIQRMIESIMSRVNLKGNEVDIILSSIVSNNISVNNVSESAREFLRKLYQSLETRYPLKFDEYLKRLVKSSEIDDKSKLALQFLTTWHFNARDSQDSALILNRLTHVSPEQRKFGLEMLAKNDINVPINFCDMMTDTLAARFSDNEIEVIKALLMIPTKRLINLLSVDTLIDELIILLSACHSVSRKMLAKPALKILLQLCKEGNDTTIFIISLPYLFPSRDEDVDVTMEVLTSNFGSKNKYMQQLKKDIGKSRSAEVITSAAFHNILNYELLPSATNIIAALKKHLHHGDSTFMFFNMVLLGSVCRVTVGSLPPKAAREAIEIASKVIKKFKGKVKLLENCNHLTGANIQEALALTSLGILPLQVGTYVLEMVYRRLDLKSDATIDFENHPDRSNLLLRLMEILFEGINMKTCWGMHYSRCLQIFFQRHFPFVQDLIRFLSYFFIKPVKAQISFHCLKMTLILLNSCKHTQWAFKDGAFVANLLIALARENNACRIEAINIMKKITQTFNLTLGPFSALLHELSSKSPEISLDPDQLSLSLYNLLSPDPDVSSQLKTELRKKLQQAQIQLFDLVVDSASPMHIKSQLLDILIYVNGPMILEHLTPFGLHLLSIISTETTKKLVGNALRNILCRFNGTAIEVLKKEEVWNFFNRCLLQHNIQLVSESSNHSPSVLLLKQIDKTFFQSIANISPKLQEQILGKLVDIITDCEVSRVVSTAHKAMKSIQINAELIVNELEKMKKLEEDTKLNEKTNERREKLTKSRSALRFIVSDLAIINSRNWKRGVTLLEFIQHASNITNEDLLYPILFDLLKTCLNHEEQSPVEYTNQLILSTLHRLAEKGLPIRDAHSQVDLITQCIRTSRNPQTHHHALLVLVELLKIVDIRRALYSIMPIFTFMGNSVVRQDDAYSIQIIYKTIDTVVPIINAMNNEIHICEILRAFIVSIPDIPEHRRMPLFKKLLSHLNEQLHLFYLLTFESHVLSNVNMPSQKNQDQRLQFLLQISREFSPSKLIFTCVKLIEFMKELPIDIEDGKQCEAPTVFSKNHIFNTKKNTPKQLRHYKFVLIQFLSDLLSSSDFINRVAELPQKVLTDMTVHYDKLLTDIVLIIEATSKQADLCQGKPLGKYWKVLLHHLYDVLDLVNNLLSNKIFLISIKRLIENKLHAVTRKGLELLNSRLQQRKFGEIDHADLLSLIEALVCVINTKGDSEKQELDVTQQTALITLKLLAKFLAAEHPVIFKRILDMVTNFLVTRNGPVLGTAALCVAELCNSLKTHAIHSLNQFVPAILQLLKAHCRQDPPDILAISIVSSLQKIVESIGNFLSFYLDQLLFEMARLISLYMDAENPKIGVIVSRLKATSQKLCHYIPLRILLPAISRSYDTLISEKSYKSIPALLSILTDSFNVIQPTDLNTAIPDLATFFLKVLEFREEFSIFDQNSMETDGINKQKLEYISLVEESTSKSLVSLVLKLSETTFRPLYYKLYDWAARNVQRKQRNITFFRLSTNIADCLKSLFVLFAGHFLKHAATLLNDNNLYVLNEQKELTLDNEVDRIQVVEAVLSTLYRIFTYDAHNFVNQERFEILMQPIVDQIENTAGTKEQYAKRANNLIIPCIASFSGVLPDDSLNKRLVYQILLKTRHAKSYVRSVALHGLIEIVRKLGENFMPLLPETVPFLAELLEDEDETTETDAREAVRTLEEILGEPLQQYF